MEIEISCSTNRLYRFDRKQFQFLFHWVSHPSFHLSLAVLVHYRFLRIFSLGGWFPQIPTVYVYHGTWDIPRRLIDFVYKAFTLYGRTFQTVLLSIKLPRWTPATLSHTSCEAQESLGSSGFARRY